MSVIESNLRFYGSANMPDVDGATTGGAIDTSKKISFSDLGANDTVDYVSSSASDTAAIITVSGRDATGVITTEAKTLTGTTIVAGSQTFERMMKAVRTGTAQVGVIAALQHTKVITAHTCQTGAANATGTTPALIKLQSGDKASVSVGMIIRITNNSPAGVNFLLKEIIDVGAGLGTDIVAVDSDWSTLPSNATTYDVYRGMLFNLTPNRIDQVRRAFYDVAADVVGGSTRIYYEKIFAVNDNTATALTGASIKKSADPSAGTLDFSLTNALNDTATVANRQTAPASGVTAYTSGNAPQSINVPAPQNLPSGAAPNAAGAQGVWLRLTLAAGTAPTKTSETMSILGNTV